MSSCFNIGGANTTLGIYEILTVVRFFVCKPLSLIQSYDLQEPIVIVFQYLICFFLNYENEHFWRSFFYNYKLTKKQFSLLFFQTLPKPKPILPSFLYDNFSFQINFHQSLLLHLLLPSDCTLVLQKSLCILPYKN